MKMAQQPVSLDTPIGDDGDAHVGDFIEDEDGGSVGRGVAVCSVKN